MSTVIIGSARHNEFYGIPGKDDWKGGQPGDQLQMTIPDYSGECSMQEWYLHALGWIVLRAKNAEVREKIAKNMENICNNPNYGYDQPHDQDGIKAAKPYGYDASCVTTPTQIDCARGVRLCILYAGINVPDFYTATEVNAIMSTGKFEKLTDSKHTDSPDYLLRGDILVTRSKGHTVVVLSDGDYPKEAADTYEITGNTVNMRSGPGKDWGIIQVLRKGDTVKGSSTNDGWLQCDAKGKHGYVSLKYLKPCFSTEPAPSFAILTGNAWMRQTPGLKGKRIRTVKKGETVTLTGEKRKVLLTTWYQAKFDGKTGWISGKYLT